MSSKGVTKAPTAKDADFMLAVLESNRGPLQIDWEQVAAKVNLKNGSTASVRFGQIKKKLGWTGAQGQTAGGAGRVVKFRSPAKPRAAAGRAGGRKPAVKTSPTKGAGRGGKGKEAKEESEDDFGDEESEVEQRAVDLMAPSEDDEVEDDKAEESEEESFEARVARGEYDDDDDDVSKGVGAQLHQEIVQEEDEEEYDAYDPDNAYYGVPDVMADAPSPHERQLYVPKHA